MDLDDANLPDYLQCLGLLDDPKKAVVEAAGDGNINYVRRVRSASGALVVKHARAWLERFPEYRAPTERLEFEHRYAEVVRSLVPDAEQVLPEIFAFDPERHAIVMEDLGGAPRLDEALLAGNVPVEAIGRLGTFLGRVHAATSIEAASLARSFRNDSMRELHGEHIYTLPFEPNEFPIDPAVRRLAEDTLGEPGVRDRIRDLRRFYYDSRLALVHGDVQAGNILIQGDRPRLLDAEICHVGDPAFDLGTLIAHLRFHVTREPGPAALDALAEAERACWAAYREAFADLTPDLERRALGHAAVEMLRRTIGAARMGFLAEPGPAKRCLAHAFGLLSG